MGERFARGDYGGSPTDITQPDYSNLDDNYNPKVLIPLGGDYARRGQAIEEGDPNEPVFTKDGRPYDGFKQYKFATGRAQTASDESARQFNQRTQEVAAFNMSAPQTQALIDGMAAAAASTPTNRLSPEIANAVGIAASIPLLRSLLPDEFKLYEGATDEQTKAAAGLQIMTTLGGLERAPGEGLKATKMAVPGPTMAPGARYTLAERGIANLLRQQEYNHDFAQYGSGITKWAKYDSDWYATHPLSNYYRQADDRIPLFAGMTRQEMGQHPRHPQTADEAGQVPSHQPFVWPPGSGNIRWQN